MNIRQSKLKQQLITIVTLILLTCIAVGILFLPRLLNQAQYGEDILPTPHSHPLSQNEAFLSTQMDFSLKLFQASVKESNDENVLLSPLSVMQALSMTANGASGKTLKEMTALLGGENSLEELNQNLKLYTETLPNTNECRLHLANSIWIREDLSVKDHFIETCQNYYRSEVSKEPFTQQTVSKINRWVRKNTDQQIDKIIDQINATDVMFLINALAFDAEWETIYHDYEISNGTFYASNSKEQHAEMMHSSEMYYLNDGKATGFIKNYKNSAYRFVALLPNETIALPDYIASLTSETLRQTILQAENASVRATIPKFECEYDISLNSVLKELGMETAFNPETADISNLGSSQNGPLFLSKVLHKTCISVNEKGTKAGAVTSVTVGEGAAMNLKEVTLNRPFLYMILDGNLNLPVFIGTVTELKKFA